MQKRRFGKEELSILGFGGIIVTDETKKEAKNLVAEAIASGINYFDVSPSYGNAEERLGPALEGKRNSVFLACKTDFRTKAGLLEELHLSLKKLKTDYFDLYQLHAMTTMEEVEQVCGPNGALETFVKARQDGLVRYLGFSAHNEEVALSLMERFDFDSILLPINWVNIFNGDFGERAIKKAQEKNVNILAIKAMAKTVFSGGEKKYPKTWYEPIDDEELASLALRYTLSKPIVSAIPPGDIRLFRWALKVANDFKPITKEEETILKQISHQIKPIFSNK